MVDNDTINLILQKLVNAYKPVTIYLFGSYAWGIPTEQSDLDIMIIVESSQEKPYKRAKSAYVALRGLCISKDILVYTVSEFEKNADEVSSLIYKIKREGIKLYEAALY